VSTLDLVPSPASVSEERAAREGAATGVGREFKVPVPDHRSLLSSGLRSVSAGYKFSGKIWSHRKTSIHISKGLVVDKQKECRIDQNTNRHILKNSNFAGRTITRCCYPNRWPTFDAVPEIC
jgi:hypothetical protein